MYPFVKTWLFTTCGGDRSTRHVQERHASTTSLILDFGCIFFLFLFSLVLSSLSKCNDIAFTLHLRGGVKGKIVISYSRVSLPLLSLMYSIYTPLGLNPNHPFSPIFIHNRIDLDTMNIIQRDALLLFRTLCKVGCLNSVILMRTNKKVTLALLPFVILSDEHERRKR